MINSIIPQTPITADEFFEIRKNLRFKYFNQPDALQFTTISMLTAHNNTIEIARGKADVYFFYYYFNPNSEHEPISALENNLEKTIQKIINNKIESPSINFQRIYDYFEELPSNIFNPSQHFDSISHILKNQKDIKNLFEKYKKELLAINGTFKPQNNQQVWI